MGIGHFIRLGDKTTCGGEVLEADNRVMMFGLEHSREGDKVSCGKDGKVYVILGGVSYIESHGRLVAGTLDSFSSCPCQAGLIASEFTASYESEQNSVPRASNRAAQAVDTPDRSATAKAQLTDTKRVNSVTPSRLEPRTSPTVCNHPDRMEELASGLAPTKPDTNSPLN